MGWNTNDNDFSADVLREVSNCAIDFISYIGYLKNEFEVAVNVIEKMDSGASSSK